MSTIILMSKFSEAQILGQNIYNISNSLNFMNLEYFYFLLSLVRYFFCTSGTKPFVICIEM